MGWLGLSSTEGSEEKVKKRKWHPGPYHQETVLLIVYVYVCV